MKLDVGCGDVPRGDVNVDVRVTSYTDVVCNAESLPFKDKSFDEAFACYIIEHCLHPDRMVQELMRVAKKVTFITSEVHWPGFYLHYLFRRGCFVNEPEHVYAWTKYYLSNFLTRIGVERFEIKGTVVRPRRKGFLRKVFYWLVAKPLSLVGLKADLMVTICD